MTHLEATQLVVRTLLRHMTPEAVESACTELVAMADPFARGDAVTALADATNSIKEMTQVLEAAREAKP